MCPGIVTPGSSTKWRKQVVARGQSNGVEYGIIAGSFVVIFQLCVLLNSTLCNLLYVRYSALEIRDPRVSVDFP